MRTIARSRSRPRDLVVADTHAHDSAQPRKTFEVVRQNGVAHDHQPVDLGAVCRGEVGEGPGGAPEDADLWAEDLPLDAVVRDLPFFGIEHGDGHRLLSA
jgi:hypothetical protein